MHSHILPAFDDGAKTVDDSLELIDHLRKQGVKNICLTPPRVCAAYPKGYSHCARL